MASSLSSSNTQSLRKSLKRPDQFFQSVTGLFSQLSKHMNGFVVALVVLFALGLGGTYISGHLDKRSDAAKNALFLANKELSNEMKVIASHQTSVVEQKAASPGKTPAKPISSAENSMDAIAYKKLDVDAQFPEAVKKLKAIDLELSSTRGAFEARMKLGDLYYTHGEVSKAVPWYEKSTQTSPGSFEKALAFSALGYAYESLGKFTDAIQSYQKSLNQGEKNLKGDILMGMARCYEALHDSAKARSIYDQILTDLPNTEYSKSAELLKGQLP